MPRLKADTIVIEFTNNQVFHIECIEEEGWSKLKIELEWSKKDIEEHKADIKLICDGCGKLITG